MVKLECLRDPSILNLPRLNFLCFCSVFLSLLLEIKCVKNQSEKVESEYRGKMPTPATTLRILAALYRVLTIIASVPQSYSVPKSKIPLIFMQVGTPLSSWIFSSLSHQYDLYWSMKSNTQHNLGQRSYSRALKISPLKFFLPRFWGRK